MFGLVATGAGLELGGTGTSPVLSASKEEAVLLLEPDPDADSELAGARIGVSPFFRQGAVTSLENTCCAQLLIVRGVVGEVLV